MTSKSKSVRSERASPQDLEIVYAHRFAGEEERRAQVWAVLVKHFFQRWVQEKDSVLDLGAGYCEFVNSVRAGKKYAMDLNPATEAHAARDVQVLRHDAQEPWPFEDASLDVIFSSNFLEHLPTKDAVHFSLGEAHRVLRPRGRILLLGPNIRFCPDIYWDFFDHQIPLSDRSLVEALELAGFKMMKVIPKFLPFTTKGGLPTHPTLVWLYLALPIAWNFLGKQFFIEAAKK